MIHDHDTPLLTALCDEHGIPIPAGVQQASAYRAACLATAAAIAAEQPPAPPAPAKATERAITAWAADLATREATRDIRKTAVAKLAAAARESVRTEWLIAANDLFDRLEKPFTTAAAALTATMPILDGTTDIGTAARRGHTSDFAAAEHAAHQLATLAEAHRVLTDSGTWHVDPAVLRTLRITSAPSRDTVARILPTRLGDAPYHSLVWFTTAINAGCTFAWRRPAAIADEWARTPTELPTPGRVA